MRITQKQSNMNPPQHPEQCNDCGSFMLSKNIGSDGLARCVACDSMYRKARNA